MTEIAWSRVPLRPGSPARRATVLACVLFASLQAGARAQVPPATATGEESIEDAERGNWRAGRDAETLPDRSVLTLYYGETTARGGVPARLRVGFVPRFECAPTIELVLDRALAATLLPAGASTSAVEPAEEPSGPPPDASARADAGPGDGPGPDAGVGTGLRDDDEAEFLIDGDPVGFPVIVDVADGLVEIAYDGNERQRATLRLQLDTGNTVTVAVRGTAEPIVFSLLGSRRTLAGAESSCLVHEPVALPE